MTAAEIEALPVPDFTKVPMSLERWAGREIQPKDFLLGEVFSTTTRAMLSADTGLGKTHFAFAMGFAMAEGVNFCHWQARRKARVLVIDGEMSPDLVQERLADAERRLGERPEGFFCLCKEDAPDMDPLNTETGQAYLAHLIDHICPDGILFDNLGSLTVGSLQDEEAWKPIVPLMFSLTAERIGQLWITHTGHDKTRDYGLKMKSWHMDTCMLATKVDRPGADIAFSLEFTKARQRKPSNRADYETATFILENDQWSTTETPVAKKATYGKNQLIVLESVDFILATEGKPSPGINGLPTSATVALKDRLRQHCIEKMPQADERRRKGAFEQAFESLTGPGGLIGLYGDYVWKADERNWP
jgi:hypothetical protein